MKNTLNKKFFKHKKISSPLAIASVMLSGAAIGMLVNSCKITKPTPQEPDVKKTNRQEAITGSIKYLALGDQYLDNYNSNNFEYFDAKNKIAYGISYASYLANNINLLSNQTTYLDTFYNLGLSNTTIDDWLYLINAKSKKSNDTIRNLDFNSSLKKTLQFDNKSVIERFFNDFQDGKNDNLISQIKEASLMTISLGLNDFINPYEYSEKLLQLLHLAKSNIEDFQNEFKDWIQEISVKAKSIERKYNALISEIRKLNKNVNISLIGYISPYVKIAKVIESINADYSIQDIFTVINQTIQNVAKTNNVNYLNFENQEEVVDKSYELGNSLFDSSLNNSAHKKLAQELFLKLSLTNEEYDLLVKSKKFNPEHKPNVASINLEPQVDNFATYTSYKSINFNEKATIIKNTILGISSLNLDSYKKVYDFESNDINKNAIKDAENNKLNRNFVVEFKNYFNSIKEFDKKEVTQALKQLFSLFNLSDSEFKNSFNYLASSASHKNTKEIVITFIKEVLNNETLNNQINYINKEAEKLFESIHYEDKNLTKVLEIISDSFSLYNTQIFSNVKEFFNSSFSSNEANKKWLNEFANIFIVDFVNSKLLPHIFGKNLVSFISTLQANTNFKNKFTKFAIKITELIITNNSIISSSNNVQELIKNVISSLKDEFNEIIVLLIETIKGTEYLDSVVETLANNLANNFSLKETDIENIKYFLHNFIIGFNSFESKDKLINLLINISLDNLNNNENKNNLNSFISQLITYLFSSEDKYGLNENHSLLFEVLSFVPNNPDLDKGKYVSVFSSLINKLSLHKLNITNLTDESFRNSLITLLSDIIDNKFNKLTSDGKDILINTINFNIDKLLDKNELVYNSLKNIVKFSIINPLNKIIKENKWDSIIINAFSQFATTEEFTNSLLDDGYAILSSKKLKDAIKFTISDIIRNSQNYKNKNYADLIFQIIKNQDQNKLFNIIEVLLEKISSTDALNKLTTIMDAWLQKTINVKLEQSELESIKSLVSNILKNIPNTKLFDRAKNALVDAANEADINKSFLDCFKDFANLLNNKLNPANNKEIINEIIDVVLTKNKAGNAKYSISQLLNVFSPLLSNRNFVNYVTSKIDLKSQVINLLDIIDTKKLNLDNNITSDLNSLISDLKLFINKNWETNILSKIKNLIIKLFDKDALSSINSLEEFAIKGLTNCKDIIDNIIELVFDDFIYATPTKNATFSRLIVEILYSKLKDKITLTTNNKNLLIVTFNNILNKVHTTKFYKNITKFLVDALKDNINNQGFNFNNFVSSKLLNFENIFTNLISVEKIINFIKNDITSKEIRNICEILLNNLENIINAILPNNSQNASQTTSPQSSQTASIKPEQILAIVIELIKKVDKDDKLVLIDSICENLKKILKNESLKKYLNLTFVKLFNKLDKDIIDKTLTETNSKNVEEFSYSIFNEIVSELIKDENINDIKVLLVHYANNEALYNFSNLDELLIKFLKHNKLNSIKRLVKRLITNLFSNDNIVSKSSILAINWLDKEIGLGLTNSEISTLKEYLISLFKFIPSSKFFESTINNISDKLSNLESLASLKTLGSQVLSSILDQLKESNSINEIIDLLHLKSSTSQKYTTIELMNVLKVLFGKEKFLDYIFVKLNPKQLILKMLDNINIDEIKFSEPVRREIRNILNNLKQFVNEKFDDKVKPLIKTLVNKLFDKTIVESSNSLNELISKFITSSTQLLSDECDNLFEHLFINASYSLDFKNNIASFLIELMDQNLGSVTWPANGKESLKRSIVKALSAIPKFNIVKGAVKSILEYASDYVAKKGFDFSKFSIFGAIDFVEIINTLNYDEIIKFVKSLTSEEIRNVILLILENINGFSNIVNTSTSSSSGSSSGESYNFERPKKGIIVNINVFFNLLKEGLGILNQNDKNLIKVKLPKIFEWFRSEPKTKIWLKEKLQIIKTKLVEFDSSAKEFAELSINKIIECLYEKDDAEKFFNSLLTSLVTITDSALASLNGINDLFKYIIRENKTEIKKFINSLISLSLGDENFVDKALQFAFNYLIKHFELQTSSDEIDNIKAVIKRVLLKSNKFNFISLIIDDLVDSLEKINIVNDEGHFNANDVKTNITNTIKNIEYDKYIKTEYISELIETILDKNLPVTQIENELYSIYSFITTNLSKFAKKQVGTSNNNTNQLSEEAKKEEREKFLKMLEKLIFNVLSAANGSIKPDNENVKVALTNVIWRIMKNEVSKLNLDNVQNLPISTSKLKWSLEKVVEYDEVRSLIESLVNDVLAGEKLVANNLGQLMSKTIRKIEPNLKENITKIIYKFSQHDEILSEIVSEIFNFLKLESTTEDDVIFLKDLTKKLIPELLKTELFTRKILKRSIIQFANAAETFDILNPRVWIEKAIEKVKSALGGNDATIIANYIGKDKVINGPTLVKLINLVLGKSKYPDSIIMNALRNLNQGTEKTNLASLNKIISDGISSVFSPKPKGDSTDPDNITISVDYLATINTVFQLLADEVTKESKTIPNYMSQYKVRSKQEAYKATYRTLVSLEWALFEMFGRETLEADRNRNYGIGSWTSVTIYKGTRAILWEIQEGTNISSIRVINSKFSGMQKTFTNEKLRREFTNYCVSVSGWWSKTYKYYEEEDYTPDAIMYLITSSGYHPSESSKLTKFKYKVSEDGEPYEVTKKEYILMTIKEGGFGKFMKLNNQRSKSTWSGLSDTTEYDD